MRYATSDWEVGPNAAQSEPVPLDLSNRPVVALAYTIGGCLMDLFGPMFWAALIVGFFYAEIFLN